jgi:uncharacterized Zn finger protein (UPF0148 family)
MGFQELKCPNCQFPALVKEDGSAVCSHCGGTFTFKAGEAHLSNVGEFDAVKRDVEELKQRLPASTPAEPPADVAESDVAEDEEGEDDL